MNPFKKKLPNTTISPLIFKQGYITKQGALRKSWKKRWFLVTSTHVFYFDTQKLGKLLGVVPLQNFQFIIPTMDSQLGKLNSFGMETSSRTYYLVCESKQEREAWQAVLLLLGEFNKKIRAFYINQQTKERTSFYSYEIQLVFKTMDLIETLSNFAKVYQSISSSREHQMQMQELSDILIKLIESSLVASKAPYIPTNTKNVIAYSTSVKNFLVTIVTAAKKVKPAEDVKKLADVLKGCKGALEEISNMIAPEFMEDIKFYARGLVKASMVIVTHERHRDEFKETANRLRAVLNHAASQIVDIDARAEFQKSLNEMEAAIAQVVNNTDSGKVSEMKELLGVCVKKTVTLAAKNFPSKGSFVPVPDELILKILSFLDVRSLVSVLRANRYLRRLAEDGSLWFAIFARLTTSPLSPVLKRDNNINYKVEVAQLYLKRRKKIPKVVDVAWTITCCLGTETLLVRSNSSETDNIRIVQTRYPRTNRRDNNRVFTAKVCLLGPSGVGKSSIIIRYSTNMFKGNTESTIGAAFFTKDEYFGSDTLKLSFWDTAGQERFESLTPMYIRGSNAVLVVYDVTSEVTFQRATKYYMDFVQMHSPDAIVILVGNKSDEDIEKHAVTTQEARAFAVKANCSLFQCSAKTGENIDNLFEHLRNVVYWQEREKTD